MMWFEFFEKFGPELEKAYAKGGTVEELIAAAVKSDASFVPPDTNDDEFTEFVNAVKLWE